MAHDVNLALYYHDGRPRPEVNGVIGKTNVFPGRVLGWRSSYGHSTKGARSRLRLADIRLATAPGPGRSRDVTAFVEA